MAYNFAALLLLSTASVYSVHKHSTLATMPPCVGIAQRGYAGPAAAQVLFLQQNTTCLLSA
jgi:hypothetical protein